MTFLCPRGHDSTDPDYCSVCGIAIPASAVTANAATSVVPNAGSANGAPAIPLAPANASVCPVCGTPRTDLDLRYCEVCRYDFQSGTASPTASASVQANVSAKVPPGAHTPSVNGPDDSGDPFAAEFAALEAAQGTRDTPPAPLPPAATSASPPPITHTGTSSHAIPAPPLWEARVAVDPSLDTDPDPALPVPTDEPDYFYPLTESETLIGRRDDRQGILPQIPVRDPGVSRRHAMLRRDADGISVMDLGSTNGTLVNGLELPPNSRRMLKNGDVITVGRWTRLTIRGDGA